MEQAQITILVILVATVGMFLWGRWRHDMVAAGALLACILAGLVPAEQAFEGLAHPAVITVACVLVLSKGLQSSGAVDVLARTLLPSQSGTVLAMVALTGLGAVLSAFMNNVGALALLMPVALQMARRQQLPPGRILMPLAFGTILGGMTTLIGTPPNLIVSGFRQASGADGFGMFDYTPVGLAVAALGVAFVALVGWRLVPERKQAGMEGFESGAYITEARCRRAARPKGAPCGSWSWRWWKPMLRCWGWCETRYGDDAQPAPAHSGRRHSDAGGGSRYPVPCPVEPGAQAGRSPGHQGRAAKGKRKGRKREGKRQGQCRSRRRRRAGR
ncbi:anion permease [Oceanimonas sp. NS1]|nr:anion permease [Oceanimonas sp. NS1]